MFFKISHKTFFGNLNAIITVYFSINTEKKDKVKHTKKQVTREIVISYSAYQNWLAINSTVGPAELLGDVAVLRGKGSNEQANASSGYKFRATKTNDDGRLTKLQNARKKLGNALAPVVVEFRTRQGR